MTVEFRVLGPLELRRDGASVPLRAAAQRAFLAALLIDRNRVVSVDHLAEAIWPQTQPRSSRHALQMTASRVRRLLGDDAAVVARAPGYALEVDDAAIDSVRFERLLADARGLSSADPARAASRAEDALALWRGDAYADFRFAEFAQEEIARLDELRQEAEDERTEALLALGHAGDLIGELEALAAAAPLRERRQAQLMRALYAAGRQADALAAYRDVRRLLLDELGLEPGRELRDLERAILRQDDALAGRPRSAAPTETARRPASVVAVEPDIALDLDPEEHERQRRDAAALVARVAERFHALHPEPFVLAFAHEDHAARAAAAAAELGPRVGVASGDALVGEGRVAGPLVELARIRARTGGGGAEAQPAADAAEAMFVGRTQELERLRAAQIAVVWGPPGIGKSRLAAEVAGDVAFARCRAYGAEPLAPLRELVARLGAPAALDAVPAEEIPLTLRRVAARAAPVAIAFDDVQWADAIVLDVIEHLAAHAPPGVRVLALTREELLEDRPAFLAAAERVRLGPLDEADALELAGSVEIAARAEGNPLFIEQLVAHAAETDAALPPTLHALLAARLDRLTPAEREAIHRAAVVGRDFDAGLVDMRAELESLVRRSLLEPVPSTLAYEERYRFSHVLIRDAAYESIPRDARSRRHEETADRLDAAGASDEEVGFHLERAAELRADAGRHTLRLREDAGRRLGAAGVARMKRGDVAGAASLLERAVTLHPDGDCLCELGLALNTLGRAGDAREAFDRAASTGNRRVAARAELERTISATADPDEVLRVAEQALRVADAVEDDRIRGRAWLLAGWARGGALGHHAEWLDAAERAARHYRSAGWSASTALGHVAATLYFGPTPVGAAVARCEALLDEAEDLAAEAAVSAHLGGLHAMRRAWDEADALIGRARSLFEELGRAPSLTRTCTPLEARAARLRGDLESAASVLEASCAELVAESASFHLASQAAELADVLCALARWDEAERWCATAERHLQSHDVAAETAIGTARIRLLVHAGDLDGAAATAGRTLTVAGTTDNLNARAAAHLAAAAALADRDAHLAAALALYRQKENAAAADAATAL